MFFPTHSPQLYTHTVLLGLHSVLLSVKFECLRVTRVLSSKIQATLPPVGLNLPHLHAFVINSLVLVGIGIYIFYSILSVTVQKEIHTHVLNCFLTKVPKQFSGKRAVFSTSGAVNSWISTCRKLDFDPLFVPR